MKLTWMMAAYPVVLALLAPSIARGEASPGAKKKAPKRRAPLTLEARLRALLPNGWTLQTTGLPDGVEGLVLGPRTKDGRAVVTLSRLESRPNQEELSGPRAQAFLASQVDASPTISATRPFAPAAAADVSEFTAVAKPSEGAAPREVRYLVSSGKPSYLLTIVAPKKTFERTYRQVVKLATRLRRSTSRR